MLTGRVAHFLVGKKIWIMTKTIIAGSGTNQSGLEKCDKELSHLKQEHAPIPISPILIDTIFIV